MLSIPMKNSQPEQKKNNTSFASHLHEFPEANFRSQNNPLVRSGGAAVCFDHPGALHMLARRWHVSSVSC